jgi:tetratricopeptide (TPR) repeat protein
MAFAARVIEQRQLFGKDTRLRIRGKEFTPTDVEKYWKRKPLNVEDAALVPHTPSCMEYWTPAPSFAMSGSSELSPSSTQTRKGKEVDNTSTDFPSHNIQSATSVDDWNFHELVQSPIVPPLMIHNAFRSQEKLIFYANEYTRASLDRYSGVQNTNSSLDESTLDKFVRMAMRWLDMVNYGQAPYTAKVLELEVGKMALEILRQRPLLLVPTLLGMGLEFQLMARTFDLYYQGYRKLITILKEHAEAVLPIASPFKTLFESVNELLEHVGPITKTISDLTRDLCSTFLSDNHDLSFQLYELLATIAIARGAWLEALYYAREAEDAAIQKFGPSNKHPPSVLSIQKNMVLALLGMGDLGQAERMIQKGLSSCNASPTPNATDGIRSKFLLELASVRQRQGRVVEAEQILHQLLKSRLGNFGPSDNTVIWVVQNLGSTTEGLTLLGES